MQFDLVLSNPPFQDSIRRGKTPHKLWIDFTKATFDKWLKPGGILGQVSPASFLSPSSKVLPIFRERTVKYMNFDTASAFPGVGSTFAHYVIVNSQSNGEFTRILNSGVEGAAVISKNTRYLPNDVNALSISIHEKVMNSDGERLRVEHDYVSCHNILRRTTGTLSETETETHIYPVLHTNRKIWWSQVRQDWASEPKVIWSRSGYTKPQFDPGLLGGTDMVYFVRTPDFQQGQTLSQNLNHRFMQYIFDSAKWSGFGNELVFSMLPLALADRLFDDGEFASAFGLTPEEMSYALR